MKEQERYRRMRHYAAALDSADFRDFAVGRSVGIAYRLVARGMLGLAAAGTLSELVNKRFDPKEHLMVVGASYLCYWFGEEIIKSSYADLSRSYEGQRLLQAAKEPPELPAIEPLKEI